MFFNYSIFLSSCIYQLFGNTLFAEFYLQSQSKLYQLKRCHVNDFPRKPTEAIHLVWIAGKNPFFFPHTVLK